VYVYINNHVFKSLKSKFYLYHIFLSCPQIYIYLLIYVLLHASHIHTS